MKESPHLALKITQKSYRCLALPAGNGHSVAPHGNLDGTKTYPRSSGRGPHKCFRVIHGQSVALWPKGIRKVAVPLAGRSFTVNRSRPFKNYIEMKFIHGQSVAAPTNVSEPCTVIRSRLGQGSIAKPQPAYRKKLSTVIRSRPHQNCIEKKVIHSHLVAASTVIRSRPPRISASPPRSFGRTNLYKNLYLSSYSCLCLSVDKTFHRTFNPPRNEQEDLAEKSFRGGSHPPTLKRHDSPVKALEQQWIRCTKSIGGTHRVTLCVASKQLSQKEYRRLLQPSPQYRVSTIPNSSSGRGGRVFYPRPGKPARPATVPASMVPNSQAPTLAPNQKDECSEAGFGDR
jgi:hypothetical protein